jgi:hypothetical protein
MFKIEGKSGFLMNQQGDVPILPVDLVFDAPKPANGRAVLALGEVTGHSHVIESPHVRYTTDQHVIDALTAELVAKGILEEGAKAVIGGLIVEGDEAVMLRHEEHAPHEISPGYKAVLGPREYVAPEISRRIAD